MPHSREVSAIDRASEALDRAMGIAGSIDRQIGTLEPMSDYDTPQPVPHDLAMELSRDFVAFDPEPSSFSTYDGGLDAYRSTRARDERGRFVSRAEHISAMIDLEAQARARVRQPERPLTWREAFASATAHADDGREEFEDASGVVIRVHRRRDCFRPCAIHNPSEHHMTRWGVIITIPDRIWRKCPHGVLHPDPDWRNQVRQTLGNGPVYRQTGLHDECDGCCRPPRRIR